MQNSDKSAFARPSSEEESYEGTASAKTRCSQNGLTKREYFTGLAMQGILASVRGMEFLDNDRVAMRVLGYADEILKQLDE